MKNLFKKHVHLFSTFCFSLLLISLSCVMSFTNTSETSSICTPNIKLYLVSTSKSQVESSAKAIAVDQMKNDGSGYVWKKDSYYYVVSSAYLNKNDAELVKNKFKELQQNAEIIEISFPVISISNFEFSPEAKSTLISGLNFFHMCYSDLFDISISLETNIYDETSAFLEINKIHAKSDEIMKNFQIIFGDTTDNLLLNLNKTLQLANEKLELLSLNQKIDENQTLISSIKYCYLEIMQLYENFLLQNA